MKKIIRITKQQYQILTESAEDSFAYISNDDTKNCDGQVSITANGKLSDGENAEPSTTDKFGKMLTPQVWNRFRSYGTWSHGVREGVEISTNKEDNTADDFYETDAVDNTKLEDPKLVQIPNSVLVRIQALKDSIDSINPNRMQKAVIANKILSDVVGNASPHEKKVLDKAVQKKFDPNIGKNIANNL